MGVLNLTAPPRTRYIDLFYTDQQGGTPDKPLPSALRDFGTEITNAQAISIDVTGQDPEGRRFATRNRNAAGSSALSNIFEVGAGSTDPVPTPTPDPQRAPRVPTLNSYNP